MQFFGNWLRVFVGLPRFGMNYFTRSFSSLSSFLFLSERQLARAPSLLGRLSVARNFLRKILLPKSVHAGRILRQKQPDFPKVLFLLVPPFLFFLS